MAAHCEAPLSDLCDREVTQAPKGTGTSRTIPGRGAMRRDANKGTGNISAMTMHRLLAATALSALMLGTAPAMAATVTMNTVQIFGTIDPAKISDYTDYMAAVNL